MKQKDIPQNRPANYPPLSSKFYQNTAGELIRSDGGENNPDVLKELGPLACLIGTWVSRPENGYNVMPLPQATAKNGFILKNFSYYEEITFSALPGKVANRGGTEEQDCFTLFYEQRVYFSDGPEKDQLVHAENGSWLHLKKNPQLLGPVGHGQMPSPPAPNPVPPQDPATSIVKQVSVPHGNSILANGFACTVQGAPDIPVVDARPYSSSPFDTEGFHKPYGEFRHDNPNINTNCVLEGALLASKAIGEYPLWTTLLHVDSDNQGNVVNIPFMRSHINVSRFVNDLWVEYMNTGELQMQYMQNITLDFPQPNGTIVKFPHIVCNTLRKQ